MTGNIAYEKKKKDSTILAIEKEEISSINVRDTDREINTIPELSRARILLGYPLTSHGPTAESWQIGGDIPPVGRDKNRECGSFIDIEEERIIESNLSGSFPTACAACSRPELNRSEIITACFTGP